jgi:Family of unknown function (DUF6152)
MSRAKHEGAQMKTQRFGFMAMLVCASAIAHHAEDPRSGKPIEWTGTITVVSWDGAHVMYKIDVENEQHAHEIWQVMGASPKVLDMRDITARTLVKGDVVTITGFLNVANKIISASYFTKTDGTKLAIGFRPGEKMLP